MSKRITNGEIREKLAVIQTENKQQTKAIDELVVTMKEQIQSYNGFRRKVEAHGADISWLKKSIWGVISVGTGITVWIVASLLLN